MEKLVTLALLGLLGSASHCVGMCGPVTLLFTRPARQAGLPVGRWLILLHTGRVGMYAALAAAIAGVGQAIGNALPGVRVAQGGLALAVALVLLYMALATTGRVPPLEALWASMTGRWSTLVRQSLGATHPRLYHAAGLGFLWGLLPCGLVYSALLVAATLGQPLLAAAGMLLFGLSTIPITAALGWTGSHTTLQRREVLRYAAAFLLFLFGMQMALRGLAAWGWVGHARVGEVMLW